MKFDQEKFVAFAEIIEDLEAKKKDISKEITESLEGFLEEESLEKKHKKQLKSAVKSYLKWKKDRAKFNEEESVYNEMLDVLCGEKVIKE